MASLLLGNICGTCWGSCIAGDRCRHEVLRGSTYYNWLVELYALRPLAGFAAVLSAPRSRRLVDDLRRCGISVDRMPRPTSTSILSRSFRMCLLMSANIPNKERPAEIPRLVILACRGHNVPEPPAAFVPLLPAVEAACKACVVPKLCAVQPV